MFTAIEIDCPKVVEIMSVFDPTIKELDYHEDLHQHFFILDFPTVGQYAIVTPEVFEKDFKFEDNGIKIQLQHVTRK